MRQLRITYLAMALVGSFAAVPAHAVTLLDTFGGPAGYGSNRLYLNDDASSCCMDDGSGYCESGASGVPPIDMSLAFPPPGIEFFGMNFTGFCLNNNGNIDFSSSGMGVSTYTPAAFPVASQRMIAPWWGDVDTRQGSLGVADTDAVYWDVRAGQVTVTWHNVGYFDESDSLQNDFQLVLRPLTTCGAGGFQVEFRYNRCEWTAGTASGGVAGLCGPGTTDCTPAQAGFDAGDLTHFYSLPGSLTDGILNVCTTSNGGVAGDWNFTICGGVITGGCPGAGEPCTVPGLFGACAHGTQICSGMNSTVCQQTVFPTTDLCDGLDEACTATYDNDVDPRPCYDGPAGTQRVGACRGGMQLCDNGVSWGTCMGEVLPSAEICDDIDNDCNGHIDDGVAPRACYTGPDGTEGVGACHGGMQSCALGVWGNCIGEELPQADTCNGIDSECNGMPPLDAGLPDCVPPPEDSSVPVDGESPPDACPLSDPHCNPLHLIGGSAGPIGCACRAESIPDARTTGVVTLLVVAFGVIASRRRRRD